MKIEQRGVFIGQAEHLDLLPQKDLRRVRSYQNGDAASLERVCAAAREHGLLIESVFDAAHGRRYFGFVYPPEDFHRTNGTRAACWDFLTTPKPTV